ncbi:MAG: HAD family hydrolase [Planctomycetes bacterium]|jgi:phosphoglycolate phosphatase|nr:HAD family hydrolase [Planctomycetota bacterium]
MVFRAVIFDLDGTLLDTIGDLADSVNAVLARFGLPGHPEDAYKTMVGDGVANLMRRALPGDRRGDEEVVRLGVAAMREEYARRWDARTRPYPGIEEMLAGLDVPSAVLSNKPEDFTVLAVRRFFPHHPFTAVRGARPGEPVKPDPAGALALAAHMAVVPAEILYLGDTNTDMRTATAAGMYQAGALWGFRGAAELSASGARTLLARPEDLLALLRAAR